MLHFTVTEKWKATYPNASAGVLVMRDVANPTHHAALNERKIQLEAALKEKFSGYDRAALRSHSPLREYHAYYKRFKKSYHVQLQLESLLFKGKSIPNVAALVEVMFMAELKNLLLTAVHDLDKVQSPVKLDVSTGNERFVGINGREQKLKKRDMFIADEEGILSNIIYGPDKRTRITSATKNVLFTVYAPKGISQDAVEQHLRDMRDDVWLITPDAKVELLAVYDARG